MYPPAREERGEALVEATLSEARTTLRRAKAGKVGKAEVVVASEGFDRLRHPGAGVDLVRAMPHGFTHEAIPAIRG